MSCVFFMVKAVFTTNHNGDIWGYRTKILWIYGGFTPIYGNPNDGEIINMLAVKANGCPMMACVVYPSVESNNKQSVKA